MGKDEGAFDKYISSVLGRLSVPKMQNSTKLRLKMKTVEPENNLKALGNCRF